MSIEESVKVVANKKHPEVAMIELDLVGEKVNKLSSPVMVRLREVLESLDKGSEFKSAVIISRKKKIFIAGADIEEIKSLKTKDDFDRKVEEGQNIMNQIEDLSIPVVAAIHGACMGGGCELILACDYRIGSENPSTKIGLPEVKLGILPGFGGCVRLPRVVGLQASLDIILAGKSVIPKKALKIGLLDKVVHASILEDTAVSMALDAVKKGKRKKSFRPKKMPDSFLESFIGRGIVFKQARKTVLKQTKGHYPAPLKALDIIQATYGSNNRKSALAIERSGFCEVATTDVSKNLINVFYLMEGVKKQTGVEDPDVQASPIKNIGVLGAGTMGGGIAYIAANVGIYARMKDLNFSALNKGFQEAYKIWGKKLKRRRMNKYQLQEKLDHISGGIDYAGFKKMDLVVEAIVEDMEIKKKVIAETAGESGKDCIIATNTSSLSVTEMSKGHPNPKQFVGMHFFNPVDKMPLVEVIRGEQTTDEVVATIFAVSKKMGKMPVVVKDGPGFLVNRLLLPWLAEALFMLSDGMRIETVDRMYSKKFGMPMGPFHLMDEIGIDVCVKVLKIFRESLGERVELPPVFEKVKESQRLGKKNKKGFYHWDEKGKIASVDQSVYSELGVTNQTDVLEEKEIIERGIFRMVNEAALVLEEQIVRTAEDVDLGMIMGAGFPPFRGGLLRYADSLGSKYIVDELELYATKYGERFRPSNPLRNMAKTERGFY